MSEEVKGFLVFSIAMAFIVCILIYSMASLYYFPEEKRCLAQKLHEVEITIAS